MTRLHVAEPIGFVFDGSKPTQAMYRLDAVLGSGSEGHVFRATNLRSKQVQALKWFDHDIVDAGSGASRRRTDLEERLTLLADRHLELQRVPGLVLYTHWFKGFVLGSPRHDGTAISSEDWFLPMELVGHDNLDRVLRATHGRPDVDELLSLLSSTAGTLEELAKEDFAHRDVRPANLIPVVVSGRAELVLVDLGLLAQASETVEGDGLGQPGFTAREVRERLPISKGMHHRADWFSFYATMYEVLAGPSDATTGPPKPEAWHQHLFAQGVSKDVAEALVDAATAPPADRPLPSDLLGRVMALRRRAERADRAWGQLRRGDEASWRVQESPGDEAIAVARVPELSMDLVRTAEGDGTVVLSADGLLAAVLRAGVLHTWWLSPLGGAVTPSGSWALGAKSEALLAVSIAADRGALVITSGPHATSLVRCLPHRPPEVLCAYPWEATAAMVTAELSAACHPDGGLRPLAGEPLLSAWLSGQPIRGLDVARSGCQVLVAALVGEGAHSRLEAVRLSARDPGTLGRWSVDLPEGADSLAVVREVVPDRPPSVVLVAKGGSVSQHEIPLSASRASS